MGLGQTRGAGFHGVNACTLLRVFTGTDCSCTGFAVSATSWAVDMVPVSAILGDTEFCQSVRTAVSVFGAEGGLFSEFV